MFLLVLWSCTNIYFNMRKTAVSMNRKTFGVFSLQDIESYKNFVKDDIIEWLTILKAHSIPDWFIVVIIHDDKIMKAKILRTSVYDKVKSDFCNRQPER